MEKRYWHKNYVEDVSPTPNYENVPMMHILTRHSKEIPDNTALIYLDQKISYRELNEASNRFANALIDMGIKPDDKVALLMPNIPQIVMAYYGVWKTGAVVVPHNPMYTDVELEYQLNNSDSIILVTVDMLAQRMINIKSKTKLKKIIVANMEDYLGVRKDNIYNDADVFEWMDLQEKYPANEPDVEIDFESICMLLYTGGTTGVSKGVMLSHANISKDEQIIAPWFPKKLIPGSVEVTPVPIFHAYGMTSGMNLSIWRGWANVLIPRPTPEALLEAIDKYKANILPAVPTMLVGMLNHPDLDKYDLTSLDGCFPAAAPVPVDLINKFESMTGCQICGCFGMSETSPCVTMNPLGGVSKVGSIGVPLPDVDVKLVDLETGTKEVAVGEEGELIIKGPIVTRGYYKMPEETAKAIRNGWLYSGDIARADEDGYLYIVDRKKDMIIAGGFNIYPLDIDNTLFAHPKIAEACAVGVPDDYRGETVKVFVVLNPGEKMTEQEVIAYCKETLAPYKVPKLVEFIDELPRASVGKVLRKDLREMEIARRKAQN